MQVGRILISRHGSGVNLHGVGDLSVFIFAESDANVRGRNSQRFSDSVDQGRDVQATVRVDDLEFEGALPIASVLSISAQADCISSASSDIASWSIGGRSATSVGASGVFFAAISTGIAIASVTIFVDDSSSGQVVVRKSASSFADVASEGQLSLQANDGRASVQFLSFTISQSRSNSGGGINDFAWSDFSRGNADAISASVSSADADASVASISTRSGDSVGDQCGVRFGVLASDVANGSNWGVSFAKIADNVSVIANASIADGVVRSDDFPSLSVLVDDVIVSAVGSRAVFSASDSVGSANASSASDFPDCVQFDGSSGIITNALSDASVPANDLSAVGIAHARSFASFSGGSSVGNNRSSGISDSIFRVAIADIGNDGDELSSIASPRSAATIGRLVGFSVVDDSSIGQDAS